MSRTRVFSAAAALLLACACSSTPNEDEEKAAAANSPQSPPVDAAKPPAPANEDAMQKVADCNDQLAMAKRKLERAQMDAEQQKSDGDAAVAKATSERDLAKKALKHFDDVEAPQRLKKAELDLKDSSDSMTEQDEEMQQLELMYSKDDLGDKTKEIVLARGKRRLERAKQRFALAQKDYDDLKAVQLAEQRERLALALKDKELELQRADFGAKTGKMDKETAVLAAQQEIGKVTRELEKAQKAVAGGADRHADGVDTDGDGFPDTPRSPVASFLFGKL